MKNAQFILIMSGLLSVAVCFHGCGEAEIKQVERTTFEASEYKSLDKEGGGTVTGRALIKTRSGDIKTLAGETVRLHRKGIYSDQWFELASNRKVYKAAYDYRLEDYVFMTIADDDGRFTFKDVPAGEYNLTTKISWFTPDDVGYRRYRTDITVENGKTLDVILRR
ncbi:MAG: carboxypeptidase-like regulatory domain-containing protein [Planctomycetes bacterium]|nr:carboxypeptidase-like regulatory domain-containing protein [Planctomycetota bacterium]